jgi:hypothetical protein
MKKTLTLKKLETMYVGIEEINKYLNDGKLGYIFNKNKRHIEKALDEILSIDKSYDEAMKKVKEHNAKKSPADRPLTKEVKNERGETIEMYDMVDDDVFRDEAYPITKLYNEDRKKAAEKEVEIELHLISKEVIEKHNILGLHMDYIFDMIQEDEKDKDPEPVVPEPVAG